MFDSLEHMTARDLSSAVDLLLESQDVVVLRRVIRELLHRYRVALLTVDEMANEIDEKDARIAHSGRIL